MRRWIFLSLILLLGCCGYSTRALLPSYLKTIYIAPVDNRTLRPLLGEELRDEVVNNFSRDGRLRVSSEPSSDLSLSLTVTSYNREAATYDASRNVTEWRYQMRITGKCKDQVKNSELWSESVYVSDIQSANTDEELAIEEIIELSAEEVVRKVLIAW